MPLANLFNLNPEEKQFWAFFHSQQHQAIIDVINQKYSLALVYFPLDPMDNMELFNENHQAMHDDFNSVLRLAGSNLSSLDLKNEAGLQSWLLLHIDEHMAANAALGLE